MVVPLTDQRHTGRWWGLCRVGDGAVMMPVRAAQQRPWIEQRDGGRVDQPTQIIKGCAKPIVGFRNLPFLRRRTVPTVAVHSEPAPEKGKSRWVGEFAGKPLLIESHGERPWQCVLHLGKEAQVLGEATATVTACEVDWAGDLDGDGHLDLFMSIDDETELLLSSKAKTGELVGVALSEPTP
jgi:hypothetical protein